jgi:hypothetical protein
MRHYIWVTRLTPWYPRRCTQRPANLALKHCMLDAFTESAFCQYRSWNTSVCTVTRLQAGQRRNHDSIPGTTKWLSPHSQSPEQFWCKPNFLCHGYWEAPVPGGKETVAWKGPVIQSIAKIEKEWSSTSTLVYAFTGTTSLHLFYILSYLQ